MPPLRDFTEGPRVVPVTVRWSPAYEFFTALWALSDKEHAGAHDDGAAFYEWVTADVDPNVRARFEGLSGAHGSVWLACLGMVESVGERGTADDVVAAIRAEEDEFKMWLLDVLPHDGSVDLADAVGDVDAFEALAAALAVAYPAKAVAIEKYRDWILRPAGELASEIASVVEGFGRPLSEHVDELSACLVRDAEATAALALTMPPERLVEMATKGIAYETQPGVESLLLVPSAVVRPWSLMFERERVRYFIYPAGDEFLEGDPDAPPAWLIKTYKALGDERRLRILGRVGQGGATLGELAELIGAAKSTVHHHIGILRSAGLIRVEISSTKETATYRLRPEVLPAAEQMLARYLTEGTS